jgi:hypothetical protein
MRATLLASCLSACSWIAVTPPADPPKPAGDCSTSFVAPGLDLLGTIAAGAFAVLSGYFIYAAGHGCTHDCGALGGAGVLVFVPTAALTITYGFSTGYGHRNVDRCRRLHTLEERQAARRTGED